MLKKCYNNKIFYSNFLIEYMSSPNQRQRKVQKDEKPKENWKLNVLIFC